MGNKPFKILFLMPLIYSLPQSSACFHVLINSLTIQKPILSKKNYFSYCLQANTGTTVSNRLQDLRFMAHMKSLQNTTENLTTNDRY